MALMGTVLVVDDEPMVRDVVTRYLERDGHRVVTARRLTVDSGHDVVTRSLDRDARRVVPAADGESARGLIERETLSIVLLDVMLPGRTDGLELCRWIRSTSDLPVILLTARVGERWEG